MRNLSFKVIPPSSLSRSISANLWRASIVHLGVYQEFPFLPALVSQLSIV